MKILALAFLALCFVFCSSSGPELPGVNFEKGSFKETLAKAQKENKLVMIDVYTDT